MPLKLNVGLTKKIGLPNYGSLGASCHLELEWESSMLQGQPDAFQQRVKQVYAACRRAVEAELASGAEERRCRLPAADEPANPPDDAEDADALVEESQPASASQLHYVRRLASRIGRAAALRVEVLTQRSFGKPLTELSRAEATRLILLLRAIKAGEVDFEAALEGAA